MTESKIQAAVVKWARAQGLLAIKQGGAGMRGSAGWPDYLFLSPNGGVAWVEFKKPGGKPTPLQSERIAELLLRRQRVSVQDNTQTAKDWLTAWLLPTP